MDKETIRKQFPILTEIELLEEIAEYGIERTFQRGDKIIRKGEYMKYMPLVFSGSIKIMREDDYGNEVLLYYLEGGNTCAMSITCCMKEEKSSIWAIAEEETKLLLVPVMNVDGWMKKFSSWKNFVMNSYATRMDELLHTLDSIAFYSLDERLLKYLKDRSSALNKKEFSITHSDIAKELNSSREAISRLLKKLENMGKVELGRNRISLIDI
jgi:CRP/FNR family transcriptional regulator